MKYRLKAYGITREILGARDYEIELEENARVSELRAALGSRFPRLKDLRSLLVAVNNEYADDHAELRYNDDIALIPPVSGG